DETSRGTSRFPSDLGRAAQETIDQSRFTRAYVRAPIGSKLLQDDAGRHRHPAAVEESVPRPVVVEVGAGRPAIALDAVGGAVAAGKTRAGLFELLVPVVMFGVTLAVVTILRKGRGADEHRGES